MDYILDDTDLRILEALQHDPLAARREIAEALGIAEGTVRNRISRMVSEGVLSFAALVNPGKLGYAIDAWIGLSVDIHRVDAIAEQLVGFPEVRYAGIAAGPYDIFIQVVVPSLDHLHRFLVDKVGSIEGIRSTQTLIVLKLLRRGYQWQVPDDVRRRALRERPATMASSSTGGPRE